MHDIDIVRGLRGDFGDVDGAQGRDTTKYAIRLVYLSLSLSDPLVNTHHRRGGSILDTLHVYFVRGLRGDVGDVAERDSVGLLLREPAGQLGGHLYGPARDLGTVEKKIVNEYLTRLIPKSVALGFRALPNASSSWLIHVYYQVIGIRIKVKN